MFNISTARFSASTYAPTAPRYFSGGSTATTAMPTPVDGGFDDVFAPIRLMRRAAAWVFGPLTPAPPAPGTSRLRFIPADVDYGRLHLGPAIGKGASKTAHRVLSPITGQPTGEVLLLVRPTMAGWLRQEVADLATLEEMGLPVMPVKSMGFRGRDAAMLVPEMIGAYKPMLMQMPQGVQALQTSPVVTRETLRSLQRMLAGMDRNDIRITDFQVMLDPATGALVVADPLGIRAGRTVDRYRGRPARSGIITRDAIRRALQVLYQRFPDMPRHAA
ncbi:hypothetical protein [Xylophilus sp. GOD-11R]|uniref:hypothetical protein n=1 Tax=Xylophilus sp. GOD-11R TaxID=3089814 RepID=UPI00298CCCB2|nr:hypothetical protein [Xylophilus sp. GOD-11R]WPB57268.1 hypothetical protein R9X41_01010 [Xylophilus sp. GOD-11R]